MPMKDTAPPTTANPTDLLDETETTAYLRCAVSTLRNWRWKGEGPRFVKVGARMVRYRRSDLAGC